MTHRPPSTVLAFDKVSLSYPKSRSLFSKQRVPVLNNISFTLESGHTVGILGRNGAGKSSLLKLMAGVLQPDNGRIIRPQPDLRISLLTMQLGFQPQLSGRENAILGCLLMGLNRRQAEELLPEIISFAGLASHIEDAVASYSSGMKARLGFSVAYYTRADILLIDEVLGVGDHEFKLKSRDAILEAISSNRTAVLVSHDETFLTEQCEKLLWFENGMLVQQGRPEEVLAQYHDYNHLVLQLARDLCVDVEAVRAHPNSRNPIEHLERFRHNLRSSRKQDREEIRTAVELYYPSRREQLSQLCVQECGTTTWIEQTRCIAEGADPEVRQLYREYEDLVYKLKKAAKIDKHALAQSSLITSLVKLLDDIAQRGNSGKLHD